MSPTQNPIDTKEPLISKPTTGAGSTNLRRRSLLGAILGLTLGGPANSKPKINTVEKIEQAIDRLHIKSGYVAELKIESGKVKFKQTLDQKDASIIAPIASLTKLLTVLSVHEICNAYKINKDVLVEIEQEDKDNASKSKQPKIKTGQKFSINNLIQMALTSSNNEAAEALARHVGSKLPGGGKGRDKFIKYMNDKAKSLHMLKSKFDSPSGLSAGNTSTPMDIDTLVLAVYNSPYRIGSLTTKTEGTDLSPHTHLRNANVLLLKILEDDPDFEALIQKTGYIDESGKCITLMVRNIQNDKIFIITLFDTAIGHKGRSGDPIRRAKVRHILSILRKIH